MSRPAFDPGSHLGGLRMPARGCPGYRRTNQTLGLDLSFLEFLGSPTEHCLYRRAYRLIPAMNTANPAAWPAHPFLEFTDRPLDMLLPRFVFLDEGNPTNP